MSSRFIHPSSIYLTEDEYAELLSNVSPGPLKRIGRRRGLVFSLPATHEEVIAALSVLPSEWKIVTEVYSQLRAMDGVEKLTPTSIPIEGDPTTVLQRMHKCLEARNQQGKEVINCQLNADGSFVATSKHYEVDTAKSEIYAKTEQTNAVVVRRTDTGLVIEHASTPKGAELARAMVSEAKLENEDAAEEDISLFGIRDPSLRSEFFVSLIKSIPGWRCPGAPTVTVSHISKSSDTDEEDEGDDEEATEERDIANIQVAMAHALTINGSNVLETDIYKRASAEGFFISSIRWTVQSIGDTEVFVELSAGFKDASNAKDFFYGVCKSFKSDDLSFKRCESRSMTSIEKRSMQSLLSDTAFKVLAKLQPSPNQQDTNTEK